MQRLLPTVTMRLFGILLFLIAFVFVATSPFFSRAATGSLLLTIAAQGNHRVSDKITATVAFYNGPSKVFEDQNVSFTYANNTFSSNIALPGSFSYQDRYALFIKPNKYVGRIFCNSELTGEHCHTPAFAFLSAINAVDLTKQVFLGGDVPAANGKVDAQDISLVMKNLGKTTPETDINGDGITDVTDYSLVLYSLGQNAADDPVQLTAPAVATPSPTFSLYPTDTPVPTSTPSATPTITPVPTATTAPSSTPTPTTTPTPTLIPTPTGTPTPTPLPRLGKNCVNGTTKVTKSINSDWALDVLRIPYGRSQYQCVPVDNIVLHWSDSPTFLGNQATWDTLNSRNIVCGLAIDGKETRQMSNFYDDKVTWEGCSSLENSINIEINGTQFDLWYDNNCNIVNPAQNPALASGELQQAKQKVAAEYGISTSVLSWEDQKYLDMMKAQEKRVLDAVHYLMLYYKIGKDKITGHFKLTSSKPDPGPRFLNCIIKKL